jgi:hypothetical protein
MPREAEILEADVDRKSSGKAFTVLAASKTESVLAHALSQAPTACLTSTD